MYSKNYITVDTQEKVLQLIEHIETFEILTYDTETTSLNPRKGKIIGFSISGQVGYGYYFPTIKWDPEQQTLQELFIEGISCHKIAKKILKLLIGKKIVCHNASFDCRYTENYYKIDLLPYLWVDTALLVHTVKEEGAFGYGGSPFALKSIAIMVKEAIGFDADEEANQEQIDLKNSIKANGGSVTKDNFEIYKADFHILGRYAAADADLTLRICNHFLKILKQEGLENFFFEEEVMPLYREVTIQMEKEGIHLNLELMAETRRQIEADQERLQQDIFDQLLELPETQEWIVNTALEKFPPNHKGNWGQALAKRYKLNLPESAKGVKLDKKSLMTLEDTPIRSFLLTGDINYLDEMEIAKISVQLWKAKNKGHFINIQSKDHLGELVFNYLKEKPLSLTETGKPQFDEDTIQALSPKYRWCESLRIYNKLNKIKSTYIDRFYLAAEDGVFYPYFKQNGTVSGRYGSDLQQLPKPKEEDEDVPLLVEYNNRVRAFFIAEPGTIFIDSDYESLEPHIFASISDDVNVQEIFNKGYDFYSTVAIRTEKLNEQTDRFPDGVSADKKAPNFLKKLDPVKRNKAKAYSLGIAYGMSPYALAMTLGVSKEEGETLHRGYMEAFPGVANWVVTSREFFKQNGYIKNQVGRIRHLDRGQLAYRRYGESIMNSTFRRELAKIIGGEEVKRIYGDYKNALNNCLNYQIQSLAASVVNRAALAINREFKKRGWKGQVVAQIHDQLVIKIDENLAEEVKPVVQHIMETTTQLPGVTLKAPPELAKNLRDGH